MKLNNTKTLNCLRKIKHFFILPLLFIFLFGFAYKANAAKIITGRVGIGSCGVYIYGLMLEKSSYGVNEDIRAKIVYTEEFSGECIVNVAWMLNNSFIKGDTPVSSVDQFDAAPWISFGKTQSTTGTQTLNLSLDVSIDKENYFDGGWDNTTFGVPIKNITIDVGSVSGLAPRVFLSGSPLTVSSGGKTTLTWESLNNYPATECIASSEPANSQWTGSKSIPVNNGDKKTQDITNLTQTTTFKLQCKNAAGSDTLREVTVYVTKPLPPVVTLTTDPLVYSVKKGESVNLKWIQFGKTPDSCTASSVPSNSQWSGNVAIEGTKTITNIQSETTFSITCSNAGGSDESSKLIKITTTIPRPPLPPVVTLTTDPLIYSVKNGESVNLKWTQFGGDPESCTASSVPSNSQWSGNVAVEGTKTITNIQSETTFSITCSNAGGSDESSKLIKITTPIPRPPYVNLVLNPASIKVGESTEVSWFVRRADKCTASGYPVLWEGDKTFTDSEYTKVTIKDFKESKKLTLTCENEDGSTSDSEFLSVSPSDSNKPLVRLTWLKDGVKLATLYTPSGEKGVLTWAPINSVYCTADEPKSWTADSTTWANDWLGGGEKNASGGEEETKPLTKDSLFMLTCKNSEGLTSTDGIRAIINERPLPPVFLDSSNNIITTSQWKNTDEKYLVNFRFKTTDPDDDLIYYEIDWKDGSDNYVYPPIPEYFRIFYPYTPVLTNSGSIGSASHNWSDTGRKIISIRAVDSHGLKSDWVDHTVFLGSDLCPNVPGTQTTEDECFLDIGLRVNAKRVADFLFKEWYGYISANKTLDIVSQVPIAAEKGTPTSPLRIKKQTDSGMKIFGIALVPPGDPKATGWIIKVKDKNGNEKPMALRALESPRPQVATENWDYWLNH